MKLKKYEIIYIEQEYIKHLHETDEEVYYRDTKEYKYKPYIGLLTENDTMYAIPLTSAKPRHAHMDDISMQGINVFKIVDTRKHPDKNRPILIDLDPNDKYFENKPWIKDNEKQFYKKWIQNALDTAKMIPLAEGTYHRADFKITPKDSGVDKFRKNLLYNQYRFLQKKQNKIEQIASAIYQRQMDAGIIAHREPDLKKLETVKDLWEDYTKAKEKYTFSEYLNDTYNTKDISEVVEMCDDDTKEITK